MEHGENVNSKITELKWNENYCKYIFSLNVKKFLPKQQQPEHEEDDEKENEENEKKKKKQHRNNSGNNPIKWKRLFGNFFQPDEPIEENCFHTIYYYYSILLLLLSIVFLLTLWRIFCPFYFALLIWKRKFFIHSRYLSFIMNNYNKFYYNYFNKKFNSIKICFKTVFICKNNCNILINPFSFVVSFNLD